MNFFLPSTKLVCFGTTPYTTYVPWVSPFSSSNLVDWKLATAGSFAGNRTQYHGPTYFVRGRLVGKTLAGTFTEIFRPVRATGIRLDAPPHQIITGGVCRGGGRFTTTRAHS